MPENTTISTHALPLSALTTAIGDVTRWRILAELSKDGPLMVIELARTLGRTETVISKHLAVLRKAGVVRSTRGRMNEVLPQFRVEPGVLDFGYGRLRMTAG